MKLPGPRTMFLIDGLGGIATALMLCVVWPCFPQAVGLSRGLLMTLGLFGVVYATYSLGCFWLLETLWRRALSILIGANVFYCVLSALVVVTYRAALTRLGISYFIFEIAVIALVIGLEGAVVKRSPHDASW